MYSEASHLLTSCSLLRHCQARGHACLLSVLSRAYAESGLTLYALCTPLQATPTMPSSTPADVIDALTKRTQDGGTEVVEAKAGKGRAHMPEIDSTTS